MEIFSLLLTYFFCLSCQSNWENKLIDELTALEEVLVRTSETGDYQQQLSLFSDQYSYFDILGNLVDKEMLANHRDEDEMTEVEIETEDLEVIPLSRDLAVSCGKWPSRSIYHHGIPRPSASRYLDIWRKEAVAWKVFRDQVTDIVDRSIKRPKLDWETAQIYFGFGDYTLQNEFGLNIRVKEKNDTLLLSIPGHIDWIYFVSSP